MSKYIEYRLVDSKWQEHQTLDVKSRRKAMQKLVEGDPMGDNDKRISPQRKVRKGS